jgi:hypothetical protein
MPFAHRRFVYAVRRMRGSIDRLAVVRGMRGQPLWVWLPLARSSGSSRRCTTRSGAKSSSFNPSLHTNRYQVAKQVARVGKPLARTEWASSVGPMTVNAYYSVQQNALFVPVAMLQPPFVRSRTEPAASDFGSLGGITRLYCAGGSAAAVVTAHCSSRRFAAMKEALGTAGLSPAARDDAACKHAYLDSLSVCAIRWQSSVRAR